MGVDATTDRISAGARSKESGIVHYTGVDPMTIPELILWDVV